MNKVVLLAVDSIDRLAGSEEIQSYPALERLTKHAAYGNLESAVITSWDLAMAHALSGIKTARAVADNQLQIFLPYKGFAVRHHKAVDTSESALDLLQKECDILNQAIAFTADELQDLLIIELQGISKFCDLGGSEKSYWAAIDNSLQALIDSMPENVIWMTFTPAKRELATKCIMVNQWLFENGYAERNLQNPAKIDSKLSKCRFNENCNGLFLSSNLSDDLKKKVINELQAIRHYSRRGSDLKILEFSEVYSDVKTEHDPDYFLIPKVKGVCLSERMAAKGTAEPRYATDQELYTKVPEGIVYVSGYQVEEDKELKNLSLLAIGPTIMATLNSHPLWTMQKYPFNDLFAKHIACEGDGVDIDTLGSAVQSRLTALGY